MSQSKVALYKAVFSSALAQANKNNVFFSKSETMRDFAMFHKLKRAA